MPTNTDIVSALKEHKKNGKTGDQGTLAVRATAKPNKPIELEDRPKDIKGKKQHWGYHLLLDVSDCSKGIDDEKVVLSFLKQLVKDLKMKPIGEPILVKVKGEGGRGTSAVQIITTSTITFHGDDDEWSAYIDVFSCSPFDPEIAIKCVHKFFNPKHVGDLWIHRDAGSWPRKG